MADVPVAAEAAFARGRVASGGEPLLARTHVVAPTLQGVSAEPQSYFMAAPEFMADPVAAGASAIAVGDISADGRDDLVFLSRHETQNPADGQMEIYAAYQRADGRLDGAVKIGQSGNNLSYQLLVADLDHDGIGDIVTATATGLLLLRSNGDGTFRASSAYVGELAELVVTDVDRDGHPDVLVDSSNTEATVVYGDGHGGIARVSTLQLPSSAERAVGDVTGDGLDDIVLATIYNRPMQEIQVYRALPSGGYAQPTFFYRPMDANQTGSLAIGDFNGDGRGDLALDEARDGASLQIYLQDGQGTLQPAYPMDRQRGSGALLAADLDRNGRTDLALAHNGWGYVGYYLQTSTGFTAETMISANQYHGRRNYFASGDLDGDGCGDLVVSRWTQSPVLIYGRGCVPRAPLRAMCRYPAVPAVAQTRAASRVTGPSNAAFRVVPGRRTARVLGERTANATYSARQ
ncbi:VCBS repeat-containing protein [Lysobacter sp. TY2-98]|uniref:FG-GAP repeat domain-containing protein n=1 Tax=Lysobacter sp. TY2-98 TaxID=2290922 RepID=UPI001964863C|nr:VCBS repeat-containing protein [Lysobacter sp. TY2-98]